VSPASTWAVALAARAAGADGARAIQLGIESDPEPPYPAGSPHRTPRHVHGFVRDQPRARMETSTV
jgi:hypothetical protein